MMYAMYYLKPTLVDDGVNFALFLGLHEQVERHIKAT